MYDAIATGALEDKVQIARKAMVADFDLCSVPLYTEEANFASVLLAARPGRKKSICGQLI